MRTWNWMNGLGAAVLATGLAGCSFSASVSSDARTIVKGSEAVAVQAQQPPAPEPPPPAVAEQPTPPPPPAVAEQPPAAKPPAIVRARIAKKKIEITEKVMFDYNKATIKPDSNPLLTDVAQVMKDHPEVSKIRIEGHTDGDGEADNNKKLSQERADAVRAFLVTAGIEEARIEAIGYGEDKPIADNKTEDGKEKNRRVEFAIVAQTKIKPVKTKVVKDAATPAAAKEAKADAPDAPAKPAKAVKAPKVPKVKAPGAAAEKTAN